MLTCKPNSQVAADRMFQSGEGVANPSDIGSFGRESRNVGKASSILYGTRNQAAEVSSGCAIITSLSRLQPMVRGTIGAMTLLLPLALLASACGGDGEIGAAKHDAELDRTPVASVQRLFPRDEAVLLEGPPIGSTILANGNVIIVDSRSKRMYLIDSTGVPKSTMGSRGAAPGQFEEISDVFGDGTHQVIAFDPLLHRLTEFSAAGTFTATHSLSAWPASRSLRIVGKLDNGELIGILPFTSDSIAVPSSVADDSVSVLVGLADEKPRVLATLLANRSVAVADGGAMVRVSIPDASINALSVCRNYLLVIGDSTATRYQFDWRTLAVSTIANAGCPGDREVDSGSIGTCRARHSRSKRAETSRVAAGE